MLGPCKFSKIAATNMRVPRKAQARFQPQRKVTNPTPLASKAL